MSIILKKIDLLSYTNKSLEKMITNGYLKWIRYAPGTYNIAYKSFFYVPSTKDHPLNGISHIFLKKMEQLLAGGKSRFNRLYTWFSLSSFKSVKDERKMPCPNYQCVYRLFY